MSASSRYIIRTDVCYISFLSSSYMWASIYMYIYMSASIDTKRYLMRSSFEGRNALQRMFPLWSSVSGFWSDIQSFYMIFSLIKWSVQMKWGIDLLAQTTKTTLHCDCFIVFLIKSCLMFLLWLFPPKNRNKKEK